MSAQVYIGIAIALVALVALFPPGSPPNVAA